MGYAWTLGYTVNQDAVEQLSKVIGRLRDLIYRVEENDPQYAAVTRLVETAGCSHTAVVVVANSLISYQLTSRGEAYWAAFSEWMTKYKGSTPYYLLQAHKSFIKNTPYNRIRVSAKKRRLEKFYMSRLAQELIDDPLRYCKRIDELVGRVAGALGSSPEAKTIVFSGKMYYYVCRACGESVSGDIPVPVDRRVAYISLTSCLVSGCTRRLRECVGELMKPRNRGVIMKAWSEITRRTGIPGYNLDSLIWVLGRFIAPGRSIDDAVEGIIKAYPALAGYRRELRDLIGGFTGCLRD